MNLVFMYCVIGKNVKYIPSIIVIRSNVMLRAQEILSVCISNNITLCTNW